MCQARQRPVYLVVLLVDTLSAPGSLAVWRIITGTPNRLVLFCWLASVVVVRNAVGRQAGRRARRRSAAAGPGAWAVGRLTLQGGPVRLRPVRATPCYCCYYSVMSR